jgi:stearoyl-CoA desaturase (delta-9 desaturase)
MGWMIFKAPRGSQGRADISDLDEDWVVVWQHKNYGKVALFFGLLFPAMVAAIWGDWMGGLVYAGIIRVMLVQQATFCINSLAHFLGDQPFDDRNSPRDNWITALVTLGEGYHNFHHEFPSDYRKPSPIYFTIRRLTSIKGNAIQWNQYDPTKWSIYFWKLFGLSYNLKQFRSNEIEKGRLQMAQKKLNAKRSKLDWGLPLSQLPVIEWDDFKDRCAKGEALVSIAGVVHDVAEFIVEHPGGKALISSAIGKDSTAIFNGGVYEHSNAAHNLLSTMRVGVLRGGAEVEIWKRGGDQWEAGKPAGK